MDTITTKKTFSTSTAFSPGTAFSSRAASRTAVTFSLILLITACSSSNGTSQDEFTAATQNQNTVTNQDTVDTQQPAANDDNGSNQGQTDQATTPVDSGDLLPVLFGTQTDLDLEYAKSGVELIEQINLALILPNDIDVIFSDCGVANAFYVSGFAPLGDLAPEDDFQISAGGAIFMCHELTAVFSSFFSDKDQAVGASLFVLLHELGHALVNQLRLPVLGIEESYVDGMSAVFLGEAGLSEGSVLAGWFFGNQSETPFFDSPRAGPQRLGDLACWGVGADPSLLEDPLIGSIAEQLILGGRNCQFEYARQRDALISVLGPNLRGNLSDVLGSNESLF